MSTLADRIEGHLKRLLQAAGDGMIEIRRCDLADRFACVPSQINYVLGTRFSSASGYAVESRRGGGGYIRIIRLSYSQPGSTQERVWTGLSHTLSQAEADELLQRLVEGDRLELRTAVSIKRIVDLELQPVRSEMRPLVRAALLRALLRLAFESRAPGDEPDSSENG
ncbi:MAG TPA: CtsR family transcriptional regulator [Limnochordia bacterium]|nr:CtsR family transcriptional regulator [Limnochordia bacterium]